jgi:TatD DNase family protein
MKLELVDSHCHVQQIDAGERDSCLDQARECGVDGFLVPALNLEDAETLFELADRHADLWIAVGVHPHEAKRWADGDQKRLAELLSHDKVVAVGECGLDFHYDFSPRDRQAWAMREQWEVAVDARLPVIVHNRDSDAEMLEMFRDPAFVELRAVFHSFCAGAEMARELIARDGVWLGISGMVTFRAADNVREIFRFAPVERILVETDTPYLAPVPYRGMPNRPAYVVEVARRVAAEVGIGESELHARTGAGFVELFQPRAAAGTVTVPDR